VRKRMWIEHIDSPGWICYCLNLTRVWHIGHTAQQDNAFWVWQAQKLDFEGIGKVVELEHH
jgi:hypothetical protein